MSVRSMTGFARVRRSGDFGELTVTLRSVNHRALDIHPHLPASLEPFEPDLRQSVKQQLGRGHVDVRVVLTPLKKGAAGLNRPLFDAYLAAFAEARRDFGLTAEPDLNAALRIPGMLSVVDTEIDEAHLKATLLDALQEALKLLNEFRDREGDETAKSILAEADLIAEIRQELNSLRNGVAPALKARLQERVTELLGGINPDPSRIAHETALIADRSDIAEETSRLGTHNDEVIGLMKNGDEVGKKLDFLLQEMNRETNTILSKTSGIGGHGMRITELGLKLKSAIEKMREQALNLE